MLNIDQVQLRKSLVWALTKEPISPYQLAKLLGMAPNSIHKFLRGGNLGYKQVFKISKYVNDTLGDTSAISKN